MNFDELQSRVRRAELVVSVRSQQTLTHWSQLDALWRRAWTPGRIVVAGLAAGFVAGKFEPRGKAGQGARWLQMIGSLSSLLASAQAAAAGAMAEFAAQNAGEAADQAEEAADAANAAADAPQAATPAPAPQPTAQAAPAAGVRGGAAPAPAEAATELSER